MLFSLMTFVSTVAVYMLLITNTATAFHLDQKRFHDMAENWQMSVKINVSTSACLSSETDSPIHVEFGYLDKATSELVYLTSTFVTQPDAEISSNTIPKRTIHRIMTACSDNYKDDLEAHKQCLTTPNIVFLQVMETLKPEDVDAAWKPAGIEVQVDMHNRNRISLHGPKMVFDFPSECELGWAAAKTTHYTKIGKVITTSDLPLAGFVLVGKIY
ncbi:hypothetical protein L596_021603 [Steinernema carpocapsae]|uniref:Uncharacterized protein n=1 Tax=Steinernema carpocapsae TaxID=34508 RepID=A0A4U5MJ80_STECR|nr:hypothetical protein L596_021603 [Steinernema carpocapsae]